jgi:hypothetical protein
MEKTYYAKLLATRRNAMEEEILETPTPQKIIIKLCRAEIHANRHRQPSTIREPDFITFTSYGCLEKCI